MDNAGPAVNVIKLTYTVKLDLVSQNTNIDSPKIDTLAMVTYKMLTISLSF